MTVLVTIDGSDRSWTVLPHAAALGSALGLRLRVARVLNPLLDVGDQFGPSIDRAAETVAARWREDLATRLRDAGIDAEGEVDLIRRRESAEDAIVRLAVDSSASVVAMSSRGAGLLQHAILGSTAMAVVGKCGRPVLLTGPGVTASPAAGGYRVLVTNDGSRDSDDSVATFARLFAGRPVEATLAGIYSRATGDRSAEEEMGSIRAHLEGMRDQFSVTGPLQTRVFDAQEFESTAGAIVRAAQELEASVIAMATHGHSVVRHLFAGSTALGVLQQSPLPVLMAAV
jgi:nucleotide-binding universal stress UspA family protein